MTPGTRASFLPVREHGLSAAFGVKRGKRDDDRPFQRHRVQCRLGGRAGGNGAQAARHRRPIPSPAGPAIITAGSPMAGPSCGYTWPNRAARPMRKLGIVGVTPFFHGKGRMPVRVMKKRQRPSDNAFEGAAFVEIEPGPRPHQCATVALLDVVDYALWANRVTPFLAQAQIAAFPHDLAIFSSEREFADAQVGEKVPFAPESFFASGLFSSGRRGRRTGRVPRSQRRTNSTRRRAPSSPRACLPRRCAGTASPGRVFMRRWSKPSAARSISSPTGARCMRNCAPAASSRASSGFARRLIEGNGHA